MPGSAPQQARLRASIAGNESWARTPDRAARTQRARDACWHRYLSGPASWHVRGRPPRR